jgi:hypothetical protein
MSVRLGRVKIDHVTQMLWMPFTLIRKTVVSKSRQEGVSAEVKEQMARHMDHSVETADHYYVSTGTKLTAMFRKTFNKFHDPFDPDENEDDNDGSVLDEEIVPSSKDPGMDQHFFSSVKVRNNSSVHTHFAQHSQINIYPTQKNTRWSPYPQNSDKTLLAAFLREKDTAGFC